MAKSIDEQILMKLDLILRVLALQIATQQESVTQGARLLKLAGLDNKTIAAVLNTSDATVRALTTKLRSGRPTTSKKG